MGKPFNLQGVGFSHIHITTTITPQTGPNAGQQFTFQQHKSAEYGNGAKVGAIEGPQMGPVQLYPGGAEPNWKLETTKREFNNYVAFVGPGWLVTPFDLTNTYQVPGEPAYTDYVDGCMLEDDTGKSSKGDAATVSLGGKCALVWPNGYHPFDPDAPRRT